MNRLIREHHIPEVVVDPDHLDSKHDSIPVRETRSEWRAGQRQRFITARRLEAWLISDWQHKRRHMGVPNLDFEPVRCGLFYSFRLGGTWVAADWWLQYFEVNQTMQAIRIEFLQEDLNKYLIPILPSGTQPFSVPPRENAKPIELSKEEPTLTTEDKIRIKKVNPLWSSWEEKLY